MEKLKSRKLWVAVLYAVVAFIGQYNDTLSDNLLEIGMVAIAYLTTQGIIDARAEKRKEKEAEAIISRIHEKIDDKWEKR